MTTSMQTAPQHGSGRRDAAPDWDDVLADIGDRIRAERQARGWSLSELADRAQVVRSTVMRLESGDSSLLLTFALVCRAMDVDMGHLLSADWRMPERSMSLTAVQVRVLAVVADGRSLAQAARDLGSGATQHSVASVLSKAYQRLGVGHLPRGQRRSAAVRVATKHGLLSPEIRTS